MKQDKKYETEKEIIDLIKSYSEMIKDFAFFKNLEKQTLLIEDYARFFSQKYSTVGHFNDFLATGAKIAQKQNLPAIGKAFQNNYNDEVGILEGKYDPNWEHETWRLRMIQVLRVKKTTSPSREYVEMISLLKSNNNIFFLAGNLVYTELFIAIEMKNLWKAMIRDLPPSMTEYHEDRIPMNPLEYIKNHAEHDGNHYKEILDATIADMRNDEDGKNCIEGIHFAFQTKKILYESLCEVTF